MAMIKGIPVVLINEIESGTDGFNSPIYEDAPITVDNVLVYPSSADDVAESTRLYGKKAVYTLAIPKGDTHVWQDQRVRFFGETWRVFGIPIKGIDANIPLDWNMKVMVEHYG